jgi:hypothetical protein
MKSYFRIIMLSYIVLFRNDGLSANSSGFISALAKSDMVGMGIYVSTTSTDSGAAGHAISNALYWISATNRSELVLVHRAMDDEPLFPQVGVPGNSVILWGSMGSWSEAALEDAVGADPSAWVIRQRLLNKPPSAVELESEAMLPGDWLDIPSNNCATVGFVSNIVQYLCVTTNLTQYSKALIPALEANVGDELFIFKADAVWQMFKLLWTENEGFLDSVINDVDYPLLIRQRALFQLKRRFGWPEDSEVPDP